MPHIFNTLPQSLFFSQVVQTMGSIAIKQLSFCCHNIPSTTTKLHIATRIIPEYYVNNVIIFR